MKCSPVHTQHYTVPVAARNNSAKLFDGLDHQKTPGEFLHQFEAHLTFTVRGQPLDPVAYIQWHKE